MAISLQRTCRTEFHQGHSGTPGPDEDDASPNSSKKDKGKSRSVNDNENNNLNDETPTGYLNHRVIDMPEPGPSCSTNQSNATNRSAAPGPLSVRPDPSSSIPSEQFRAQGGKWKNINRRKNEEFAKSRTIIHARVIFFAFSSLVIAHEVQVQDDSTEDDGDTENDSDNGDTEDEGRKHKRREVPDDDQEMRLTRGNLRELMRDVVGDILHRNLRSPSESKRSKAKHPSEQEKALDSKLDRKSFLVSDKTVIINLIQTADN
jgi:hypothetical protein